MDFGVAHLLDELLELNGIVMSLSGAGILTLLGATFRLVYKNYKASQDRIEKLNSIYDNQKKITDEIEEIRHQGALREQANLASLHDRIYSNFELIFKRSELPYVTLDELSNLEYLWKAYRNLGGNGTGQKMYERILDLPIKGDED